jgi:putative ABC transport system permease protein
MKGILKLAYKLLVNDRATFAAVLVGITFAVFLMIQRYTISHILVDRRQSCHWS